MTILTETTAQLLVEANYRIPPDILYLAAIGGLGALLGKRVEAVDVLAFPELGTEALCRFRVCDFPAVVIIDRAGANFHETARAKWRRGATKSLPPE